MSDEEYFEQLVSSSLDGTLTESEREKLEAHLAECPSCAALKHDLEQMRALFAVEAELPAGLHDDIMQGVRQEQRLRVVQPEKPVRRMPVLTMVAAAAVVVLVVLGGGLMPAFSTVGGASTTDAATAEANTGSDGAISRVRDAASDAGLTGGSDSDTQEESAPESAAPEETDEAAPEAKQATPQPASGDTSAQAEQEQQTTQATAETAPASGDSRVWEGLQPSTPPEAAGDAATQGAHVDITLADALPVITVPDSLRGSRVAHCYLATGGETLPDVDGELLYTDEGASWISLENNMSLLQDTLKLLEDAGFTVSAFDEVGLTIDSKAATWLLIVETGS